MLHSQKLLVFCCCLKIFYYTFLNFYKSCSHYKRVTFEQEHTIKNSSLFVIGDCIQI